MVYIKTDKEGRKDKTDPKSEVGYWGAKSEAAEVSMFGLMDLLVKRDYMGVHEVLQGDKYRPYADVDCSKGITEDNFKLRHLEIYHEALQIMEDVFPDSEINCYCSSGKKEDGSWKVSFHFVGTGFYFREKGHIRFLLRDAPDMFDRAVYDHNHLMRMPYCTKPDSQRKLRKMEVKMMGRVKEQFVRYYDAPEEHLIADGLVTEVNKYEKEMPAPEDYKEPVRNAVINAEGDEGAADEKRATWTFEKAQAVIARLKDDRADTHKKRIDGLFSILHLGRSINRVRKFRELAHQFAKKDGDYR